MADKPDPKPLEVQVVMEQKEIEMAPTVSIPQIKRETGMAGRCAGCGQWSLHLVPCHDYSVTGNQIIHERYKGLECCGGRYQ